jgi:phospholipase/carboxylesterase
MILETVEHETGPAPTHSIIWLHGLGADGNDFAPVVPELADPSWPATRFVFPHAAVRPVTINNGMPMRAWYDIESFDEADRQRAPGIRESVAAVEALITRENDRGVPAQRIVLAGFSQGGAVALSAALRYRERLAGLVALSTYLPLRDTLTAESHTANAGLPIFWGHGTADPMIPLALGAASRDVLLAGGADIEWHAYPMAHQVSAPEIADLRTWLTRRLTD